MRFISSAISALFIVSLMFSFSASAISDNALWEDSDSYNLFSEGSSNCSLNYAFAKVKYDYPSNRIHILFMMSFDSFSAEENSGVEVEFNDLGTITLMADGTEDYDDSVYFAQIDDVMSDSRSQTVYIETTFGIKSGIPENLVMTTTIYDTEGISSNEFSTDISSVQNVDVSDNSDTEEEAERTNKEKTTKVKTTKTKTTKTKTTKTQKSKTTKAKTTKTKKSTTEKSAKADDDEQSDSHITLNNEQADSRISTDNKGKRIIAVAAAGIAVCFAVIGCVVGIRKNSKTK